MKVLEDGLGHRAGAAQGRCRQGRPRGWHVARKCSVPRLARSARYGPLVALAGGKTPNGGGPTAPPRRLYENPVRAMPSSGSRARRTLAPVRVARRTREHGLRASWVPTGRRDAHGACCRYQLKSPTRSDDISHALTGTCQRHLTRLVSLNVIILLKRPPHVTQKRTLVFFTTVLLHITTRTARDEKNVTERDVCL